MPGVRSRVRPCLAHAPRLTRSPLAPQKSDVVGKLEALRALSSVPAALFRRQHSMAGSLIKGCLVDTKKRHGFRERAAAALALARWQNMHAPHLRGSGHSPGEDDDEAERKFETWDGLKWLVHAYKVCSGARVEAVAAHPLLTGPRWWRMVRSMQSMFCDRETGLPTALQFTSLAEYELRKAICAAVACIRDAGGVTPLEVRLH